jgi:hypothetical protein
LRFFDPSSFFCFLRFSFDGAASALADFFSTVSCFLDFFTSKAGATEPEELELEELDDDLDDALDDEEEEYDDSSELDESESELDEEDEESAAGVATTGAVFTASGFSLTFLTSFSSDEESSLEESLLLEELLDDELLPSAFFFSSPSEDDEELSPEELSSEELSSDELSLETGF